MTTVLVLSALIGFAGTDQSSASENLKRLSEGNKRFAAGKSEVVRPDLSRRPDLAKAQHPFAVVVTCSDSRLSPEFIFDQDMGSIFVVRVAGNLVDTYGLASAEYAVDHLGARMIIVLGHDRCGAVIAAMETFGPKDKAAADVAHDDHADGEGGHIGALLEGIKPAILATSTQNDPLNAAIAENVRLMVKKLKTTPGPLKTHAEKGEIAIMGATYKLASGEVTFLK